MEWYNNIIIGNERITVVADTSVEVLVIDKFQVNFRIKCSGQENTIYKLIQHKSREIPLSYELLEEY